MVVTLGCYGGDMAANASSSTVDGLGSSSGARSMDDQMSEFILSEVTRGIIE